MKSDASPNSLRRTLTVILLPVAVSFGVGILTVVFSVRMPMWAHYLPTEVASLVSGVAGIARYSADPRSVVLIMGYQWVFMPWYIVVWFIKFAPWRNMPAGSGATFYSMPRGKRLRMLAVFLALVVYALGDLGVIHIPTMTNSEWAYPPERAIPLLRSIYISDTMLMLYAWSSVVCEVVAWWALFSIARFVPALLGLRPRGTSPS